MIGVPGALPQATMSLAFGQDGTDDRCSWGVAPGYDENWPSAKTEPMIGVPGALPQATVRTGLRPEDTHPGTTREVQGRQPCTGFAVKKVTVDAKRLNDGTDFKTITRAVSPGRSPLHRNRPSAPAMLTLHRRPPQFGELAGTGSAAARHARPAQDPVDELALPEPQNFEVRTCRRPSHPRWGTRSTRVQCYSQDG